MAKADEELSKKMKRKTLQLLSGTSFHGVPKVVTSEIWLQKIIWVGLIMASFVYCSMMISRNLIDYFDYPVVTNIQSIYEKEPEFPAVTFCNSNGNYYIDDIYFCVFNQDYCTSESVIAKNFNCYSFNLGLNASNHPVDILKSITAGPDNGLTLTLKPTEYKLYIYIHNQSLDYDVNRVITVASGMDLSLVIGRTFHNKLDSPFSNCKKGYLFDLGPLDAFNKTFYPYFQSDCFYLCKIQKRMEICNRTREFILNKKYYFTNTIYFYEDFYYPELDNCDSSLINSIENDFLRLGENKICEELCPGECNSISYSITAYSNFLNRSYSRIHIYYEDFWHTLITEQPKTNSDSLFGTIGGLLGLFLGTSVLSFFEITDLVYSLFYILFQHLRLDKNNKKNLKIQISEISLIENTKI